MKPISTYLNKPTFYNTKPWIGVLCGSCLVFFLLITLEPFSISHLDKIMKYYKVGCFTLITATSCSIVGYLFPVLFKNFYSPTNWTVRKDLINHALIVLLITIGNTILNYVFDYKPMSRTFLSEILHAFSVTLAIGLVAGTITHFIVHNYTLKRNLLDTKEMNNRLKEGLRDKASSNYQEEAHSAVVLTGNTKDSVNIDPQSILYIESSANYVNIHYIIDDIVKQTMLRPP